MEKEIYTLTKLSAHEKVVLVTRVFFCSEHIRECCKSLGLRPESISVDNLTTIEGTYVVNALVEGLEEGLARGVKKIMDQRAAAADKVAGWVQEDG